MKGLSLILLSTVFSISGCDDGSIALSSRQVEEQAAMADSNDKITALAFDDAIVDDGNRARLEKALKKAQQGGKIVFGAIGGSITQGAAASTKANRYASIVAKWFEKKFGKENVEFINAGLGATGTGIASHRVSNDLLRYYPDIVITEFAVNDPNEKSYAETYEGLLRQILKQKNHPAVLMVFMMSEGGENAQGWQGKLGYHYGLPMISYRDALWPEIKAGRLKWDEIAADWVHPNDNGHNYCAKFIINYLEMVYEQLPNDTYIELPLPKPLISNKFEYTRLLTFDNLKPNINKGWEKSDIGPLGKGWQASEPGSILEFEVEGSEIRVVYYRVKGDMGTIIAQVDDFEPVEIDSCFDQDWGGYECQWPVAKELLPGKHVLRIELLEKKNKKSNGHFFKLRAVMAAGISK